jgi:hypothetical protein
MAWSDGVEADAEAVGDEGTLEGKIMCAQHANIVIANEASIKF